MKYVVNDILVFIAGTILVVIVDYVTVARQPFVTVAAVLDLEHREAQIVGLTKAAHLNGELARPLEAARQYLGAPFALRPLPESGSRGP